MIDQEQIDNWSAAAVERPAARPAVPAGQALDPRAPRLIGLCGPAGSGKSTAAAILAKYGYTRLRFSGPLKDMLRALLRAAGVPADEAERMVEGDLKEVPQAVLAGRTPRHAMQTLGTEWGRSCLGADFWMQLTMQAAAAVLARGGRVVIEDVRFPNEAAAVKGTEVENMTGVRELWMLRGRGGIAGDHASEGQYLAPDTVLDNSGDLAALEAQLLEQVLP